jgi:hypothetical protein
MVTLKGSSTKSYSPQSRKDRREKHIFYPIGFRLVEPTARRGDADWIKTLSASGGKS